MRNWSKQLPPALLMALLMFTLDHLGWLDWLERATIEISAAMSSVMPRMSMRGPRESANAYEDSAPRSVLIDEGSFQGAFAERTPLNRRRLVEVIETVLASGPRILAIDIDLSPVAAATAGEAAGQEALDALLIRASAGTTIVLVTPFPTSLPDRARLNAQWMRKLCTQSQRLSFAYSHVARNQGIVTKIHPRFPSLGNVAFAHSAAGSAADPHKGACADLIAHADKGSYPPYLDTMFIDVVTAPLRQRDALVPMNINYFEEDLSGRLSFPVSRFAHSDLGHALKGHIVFLGTDIRTLDSLVTASGAQPGVLIHAATYFTRVHPITALPAWLLFVIESALGLALMVAFTSLWRRYEQDMALPTSNQSLARQARAIVLASRWSAAVIAITVLVILFTATLSGFLLAQATWFNFAPIAIATAIKARESAAEAEQWMKENSAGIQHKPPSRARSAMKRFLRGVLNHPWLTILAVLAALVVVLH
ncbi:MAG TPA: CHASE2 domain-containing protein [Burkholderiales bacterium]|nr:CHASE2 domain-containing protein [Burkholderiales bacterium]